MAEGNAEGLRVNQDRLTYWQGVGAQVSNTVARIVRGQSAAA
jgi:small subunit ribosomal protein S16